MAKIIIKNTNTVGNVPSSLSLGELAVNVADGTLFFGDGHTVKKIAVSRSVDITGTVTSVGFTEGTGIDITGNNPITSAGSVQITNTAPDRIVTLTNGTGINVTGTYPDFTITNTVNSSTFVTTSSFNAWTGSSTSQFAGTASFASTASSLTTLNQNVTLNGNLTVTGTGSFDYLKVNYIESSSIIYSSGSNQLGDAVDDIQTLYGSVKIPTGSLTITGSVYISGSLNATASWAVSASQAISTSYATTASFVGTIDGGTF